MVSNKQYLTYELLKPHQDRIRDFFAEWLPKMTNRAQFKPEFDYAFVSPPPPNEDQVIATVRVGMIETILRPMNFTYVYYVYQTGIVYSVPPTHGHTGGRPYGYPVEKWADQILAELNPVAEEEKLESLPDGLTGTIETPDLHDHGVN